MGALSTPSLHYSPIHLASPHHGATEHGLKTKACSNVLNSLVTVAAKEVKKTGVFAVPGFCRIKTRTKPATKACTKMIFGKETKVKAKLAKTVVKAFPVAALKKQI